MGCTPSKKDVTGSLENLTQPNKADAPANKQSEAVGEQCDSIEDQEQKNINGNLKKKDGAEENTAVVKLDSNNECIKESVEKEGPLGVEGVDATATATAVAVGKLKQVDIDSDTGHLEREEENRKNQALIDESARDKAAAAVAAVAAQVLPNEDVICASQDPGLSAAAPVMPVDTQKDGGDDPAQVGAKSEDRFYNNKAFQQPDVDPSNPEQQDAALKIQTKYRQHHAKQVVDDKRQEAAATKIQAGFRGMRDRDRVKGIKKEKESASEKADSEVNPDEDGDANIEDPEVQAAATKIQAGFKGYKARQEIKAMKEEKKAEEEPKGPNYDDPEVQAAATKIQAGFKGYKTRQDMKIRKEQDEPTKDASQDISNTEIENTNETKQENVDSEVTKDKLAEESQSASEIQAEPQTSDEKPVEPQTSDEKPAEPQTSDEKPAEPQTLDEKPVEPQTSDEKPAEPQTSDEKPAEPQTLDEKPVEPQTSDEKPAEPQTSDEKPVNELTEESKVSIETKENEVDQQKPASEDTEQPAVDEEGAKDGEAATENEAEAPKDAAAEDEVVDIDLNDPEVQAAATKIQAGFKGMKVRKEMAEKKDDAPANNEEQPDIDLNDPEVAAAASKIQAGFKGYKTRKDMAEKKSQGGEGEKSEEQAAEADNAAEAGGEDKTE